MAEKEDELRRRFRANSEQMERARRAEGARSVDPQPLLPHLLPMADMTREEIDAKIAASEARGETGLERAMGEMRSAFARIDGRFDTIDAKISHLPTTWAMLTMLIATGLAIIGVTIAVMAYGGQWFSNGLGAQAIATAAAQQALAAAHR